MNYLFLTILLSTCMLNASAQDGDEVSTSQTIASSLETKSESKVNKSDESMAVSIGNSSLKSKIYSSRDVYTGERGLDVMVEYDYVYPSHFGLGITIAFNRTKLPYDNIWIKQLFAGPSLVYAGYLGKKWWGKADLGLGYGNFINDNTIDSGIGGKSSLSIDYMVTPTIGIGAQLSAFTTFFGKSKDYGRDGETDGVARLGFAISIRKHL